jgi:hypothetical protein
MWLGSMATCDGKVMIESGGKTANVTCSRWEELGASIAWHSEMAEATQTPTTFRLLNPPGGGAQQMFTAGTSLSPAASSHSLDSARKTMSTSPCGRTPLCAQIREVFSSISRESASLNASGKKALVVIASDGASSDGDVAAALRLFRDLPVWVVIRLCTDEDAVVNYWNGIDEELELDMDVLDDLCGEAAEANRENGWLTYGRPLHQLREWGVTAKEFDLLDERTFNGVEARAFLNLILGDGKGRRKFGSV